MESNIDPREYVRGQHVRVPKGEVQKLVDAEVEFQVLDYSHGDALLLVLEDGMD